MSQSPSIAKRDFKPSNAARVLPSGETLVEARSRLRAQICGKELIKMAVADFRALRNRGLSIIKAENEIFGRVYGPKRFPATESAATVGGACAPPRETRSLDAILAEKRRELQQKARREAEAKERTARVQRELDESVGELLARGVDAVEIVEGWPETIGRLPRHPIPEPGLPPWKV